MKNIAAVYPANCHPRGCGLASRVNRLESVRGFCELIGGTTYTWMRRLCTQYWCCDSCGGGGHASVGGHGGGGGEGGKGSFYNVFEASTV